MVKRHKRASFGSTFAFPGGVLEDCDSTVHDFCAGASASRANELLNVSRGGLAYYSAGIRELFEETGVLLALHALSDATLASERLALDAGTLSWEQFLRQNDVSLNCDMLHYFSFWITPTGSPKRYSTRFFLAAAEREQRAMHDGGEITESRWMPAAAVLTARKNKQMKVPYPTRKTLQRLARFDSTESMIEWAAACAEQGVICDRPAFKPEEIT